MKNLRGIALVTLTTLIGSTYSTGVAGASVRMAAQVLRESGSPQARTCPVASVPKQLPEVAALLDVEGLRREIAREGAAGPSDGEMVFSIRFSAEGQREWVEQVGTDPGAPRSRLRRLAGDHVRLQSRSREPWSVRLHVTAGDSMQFRVERSQVCPAQPVVDRGAVSTGTMIVSGDELRELQRSRDGSFAVEVGPTGAVLKVEVLQSTGSQVRDEQMLQRARMMRFRPALVDGIPVAGRFEVKSRMRAR